MRASAPPIPARAPRHQGGQQHETDHRDSDLDGSGDVGITDFLVLLAFWGPCDVICLGDLDGDGVVGILDFLQLLSTWGPCP